MRLRFLIDTPATASDLRNPDFRRYVAGELADLADDATADAFIDAGMAEQVAAESPEPPAP